MESSRQKWWVLGTVCFALFMINLDGNVVSLALPTIIRDFHASLSELEWISNAYMLTFAVFLITLGRLGDEIGRKKLFLGGLLLFTVGSLLCGVAANVTQLIVFRVVQGIGGSAMMPATLALIAASFPKEERGRAMGFWGAVSGLAFIAGPILGGYLTQSGLGSTLNTLLGVQELWRYVFYVNLPIGAAALAIGLVVIPESRDSESRRRLDVVGVLLSSLAVLFLTYGFVEGPRLGWWAARHPATLGNIALAPMGLSIVPFLFAAAAVSGFLFLRYEQGRRDEPLVDLALFRNTNYSIGMIIGMILNFAVVGATFLLPLFFQGVLGVTPMNTGAILIPFALAIIVSSLLAGFLADRVDGKYLLIAGLAILALSEIAMGQFRIDTKPVETIVPFIIMGIGMGVSMTPLTNLTLFGLPEAKVGGASGVLSTTRQIGAVMGVAIFSVILQTAMVSSMRVHVQEVPYLTPSARAAVVETVAAGGLYGIGTEAEGSHAGLSNGLAPATAGTSPPVEASRMREAAAGLTRAAKQSFTDSINRTFAVASLVALLGVIVSFFLRSTRRSRKLSLVREPALRARAISNGAADSLHAAEGHATAGYAAAGNTAAGQKAGNDLAAERILS